MRKMGSVRRFWYIFLLCGLTAGFLPAQTVRSFADMHFSSVTWTSPNEYLPAVEIAPVPLPGGNETFPSLGLVSNSTIPALYPEYPELGTIEYAGIEESLLEAMRAIASDVQSLAIDPVHVAKDRPFVVAFSNLKLSRLSAPSSVVSARPEQFPGYCSVRYALRYLVGDQSSSVYLTAEFVSSGSAWLLRDLIFDGESYAASARSN